MDLQKVKSFWDRPEGTTGMLTLAVLGAGGLWVASWLLPTLIMLVQNTLYLGVLSVATAGLGWFVLNPKTRLLTSYIFQSVMRAVTSLFITIDPIGILENYVERLKKRYAKAVTKQEKLNAQTRKLGQLIAQQEQQASREMEGAAQAQKLNKRAVVFKRARQAGRLQQANVELTEVFNKQKMLQRALTRYLEITEVMIADIEGEVDVQKRKREAIQASYGLMKDIRSILEPNPERELYEQTLEYLTDDYGQKVAEIESFFDMTSDFIDASDIDNGVFEAKAFKMIEEWEKKGGSLLGAEKQRMIEYQPTVTLGEVAETEAVPYRELIRR